MTGDLKVLVPWVQGRYLIRSQMTFTTIDDPHWKVRARRKKMRQDTRFYHGCWTW